MRFIRVLDEVLGQRSKVALLRLLVRTRGEHTGRELARLADLDHKTCHAALRALARQGVVLARRMGNALAYRLNDEHAVVQLIVAPAFEMEEKLVELYAEEARRQIREPLEGVVLFGSVGRGEEEEKSDVDLLFVARDEGSAKAVRAKVQDVMPELARRYGNVPQIVVVTGRQFREGVRRGLSLYLVILQTGRVLYGKSFAEILKDGSEKDRYKKRTQR